MTSIGRFSAYRIMWVIVFFDLPTESKKQRKAYATFRKQLIADGFVMFQFSIYVRSCPSKENADVHSCRIFSILPPEGRICVLTITDKQFSEIKLFECAAPVDAATPAMQLELF